MDTHANQRAMIFIDGSNFYHKLKNLTSEKEESFALLEFLYKEFGSHLIKKDALIEIRYYIGAVKRQAGPIKKNQKNCMQISRS
jgi:hypothetical protein